MKSNCSKQKCKVNGVKPTMVQVEYNALRKERKVRHDEEPCSKIRRNLFEASTDDEDVMFQAYYLQ